MTMRLARWKTSSSLHERCCFFTRFAITLCQRSSRMANVSKAGFWFVLGSPSTEETGRAWVKFLENVNCYTHDIISQDPASAWHVALGYWTAELALYSSLAWCQPYLLKEFRSGRIALHSARPQMCCRWNSHRSKLSFDWSEKRVHISFRLPEQPSCCCLTCSLGAFGLWPVLRSYAARWKGM